MTVEGLENINLNYNIGQLRRSGDALRDKFANYLISSEGLAPWQDQCVF